MRHRVSIESPRSIGVHERHDCATAFGGEIKSQVSLAACPVVGSARFSLPFLLGAVFTAPFTLRRIATLNGAEGIGPTAAWAAFRALGARRLAAVLIGETQEVADLVREDLVFLLVEQVLVVSFDPDELTTVAAAGG